MTPHACRVALDMMELSRTSMPVLILLLLVTLSCPSISRGAISTSEPKASKPIVTKSMNITYKEMKFKLYRNPKSDCLILFLHGGPHDESWFLHASVFQRLNAKLWVEGFENESSAWSGFLEYFAGNGFNMLMPYSYYYSDEREPWVYDVALSLMRELRLRHAYVVGYSSGGVVAANSIMGSTVFEKAIIISGALCGYYGKREDIFSSAYAASRVGIPHLLIWGANDSTTPVIQAQIWMKNADPKLATLRILEYSHDFRGTAAENEVRLEALRFLRPNGLSEIFAYIMEIVVAVAVVTLVFQSILLWRKRRIQPSPIARWLSAMCL